MAKGKPVYFLTDYDIKKKRALDSLAERQIRNTGGGGRGPGHYDDQEGGHQAPEVYIARTDSNGLAAFDQLLVEPTGTGTLGEQTFRIPYADCKIYRITYTNDVPDLEHILGFTHRVHNIHEVAIPPFTFFPIARNKEGFWLAQPFFCCGEEEETGTGTATDDETGTSTETETGTSTGTEGCDAITLTETECAGGILRSRTVWLDIVNGCLVKSPGSWTIVGCCDCDDDDDTGTGTGTGTDDDDVECECDVFPATYTSSMSGFSFCLSFNGGWTFTRSGDCTYTGTNGTATAILTLEAGNPGACDGNLFTIVFTDGANTATYMGHNLDCDCCVTIALAFTSGTCSGTKPTIYLVPGSPCEGDTGTASVGTGTEGETGTSTGQGIGAGCDCDIPARLVATFAGAGCLNGASVVLTPQLGTNMHGEDSSVCSPATVYVNLGCTAMFPGSPLQFSVNCDGHAATLWSVDCPGNPFTFVVSGLIIDCEPGPGVTYTITVTE